MFFVSTDIEKLLEPYTHNLIKAPKSAELKNCY